jgi:hypothetical protein
VSIPNTNTASPTFVTEEPDWSLGITLTEQWASRILPTRSELEQSIRMRSRPRIRMEYGVGTQDAASQRLDDATELSAAKSPVIVPIWPFLKRATGTMTSNTLLLDLALEEDRWRPGEYLWLRSAAAAQFRRIASTNYTTRTITLDAIEGEILFPANTACWPCIKGLRDAQSEQAIAAQESTVQRRIYTEL